MTLRLLVVGNRQTSQAGPDTPARLAGHGCSRIGVRVYPHAHSRVFRSGSGGGGVRAGSLPFRAPTNFLPGDTGSELVNSTVDIHSALRWVQSLPRSAKTLRLSGGTLAMTRSASLNIERPSQLFEMVWLAVRSESRTAAKP